MLITQNDKKKQENALLFLLFSLLSAKSFISKSNLLLLNYLQKKL